MYGSIGSLMKSEQRLFLKDVLSGKYKRDLAQSFHIPPLKGTKVNRKPGTRENCPMWAG